MLHKFHVALAYLRNSTTTRALWPRTGSYMRRHLGRCHNVGKRTRTCQMIGREAYPEAAPVQDWHRQLDKDDALKP